MCANRLWWCGAGRDQNHILYKVQQNGAIESSEVSSKGSKEQKKYGRIEKVES